ARVGATASHIGHMGCWRTLSRWSAGIPVNIIKSASASPRRPCASTSASCFRYSFHACRAASSELYVASYIASFLILSPSLMASSMEAAIKLGDKIDRKSTRLNSSHVAISYAVFCLKKKKKKKKNKQNNKKIT